MTEPADHAPQPAGESLPQPAGWSLPQPAGESLPQPAGWSDRQVLLIALLTLSAGVLLSARWLAMGGWWTRPLEVVEPLKAADLVLDLNQASWMELTLLPEVGNEKARRIVALREELGGFRTVDQLTRVQGISKRIVENLAPHLRVGAGPSESGLLESGSAPE